MDRDQVCIICGHRQVTLQHILPRGMGGTQRAIDARFGIALCGSGTTGCHGAVETRGRHETPELHDATVVRPPLALEGWSYQLGYLLRHDAHAEALRNDPELTHVVWGHADRCWWELFASGVRTRADRPAPDLALLGLVYAATR